MMWRMSFVSLLIILVLFLATAALVRYLFFSGRK